MGKGVGGHGWIWVEEREGKACKYSTHAKKFSAVHIKGRVERWAFFYKTAQNIKT